MENNVLYRVKSENFHEIVDGKQVNLYKLSNENGLEVYITNYGGFIVSLLVPDKEGKLCDVVLGYENLDGYINAPEKYLGSVIGRYGNRIAKGCFHLEGKEYKLAVNNGPNHLHGGLEGFNRKVWDVLSCDEREIVLGYTSKDGEEGYPGTLKVIMTYTLTKDNDLKIDYLAETDKTTVVGLTNHAFFNLSGAGNETVMDHSLMINADFYTPTDDTLIPTGEILKVDGTPLDFKVSHLIGERINADFLPLKYGKGYDHNFVLSKSYYGELSHAATASSPVTGIQLDVYTTEPGVQLYTGNWLSGFEGKNHQTYGERSAFCLETQHFPDTPNHAHFPSCVLKEGEKYRQICIYKFS